MQSVPEQVTKSFEGLRKEYGGRIILKSIRGMFLVFERRPKRLLDEGIYSTPYSYIARITESGLVVPARHRKIGKKEIEAILEKNGNRGQVLASPEETALNVDEHDIKIIESLSSDGRMSAKSVGEQIGTKTTAAFHRLSKLERKYGIVRVVELNMEKFGYSKYILLAKFLNSRPDIKTVKEALSGISEIQFACMTIGRYDMLMFIYARDSDSAAFILNKIAISTELRKYDLELNLTPFFMSFGLEPVNPDFINSENMRKNVWARKRGVPKPLPNQITSREYEFLKVIVRDGGAKFADIDKLTGMGAGTSRHIYERLEAKGIIKRTSIALRGLDFKYNSVILTLLINGAKMSASRKEMLKDIIEDTGEVANKYSMVVDMTSPYGILRIMPVFRNGEAEKEVDRLNELVEGAQSESMTISDVVKGEINYRRIRAELSKQYEALNNMRTETKK